MTDDPDAVFREARARHGAGDVAGAAELYRALLRMHPALPPVLNMLGLAAMQLGRFDEALAAYDRALACDGGLAPSHRGRALALLEMKRPGEALAAIDKALATGPDDAMARGIRGSALRALQRPHEALLELDRALERNPDDLVALNNRGAALQDLERWDEALAVFDRVLARNPNVAEAHCNRCGVLTRLGRNDEALAAVDRALAFDPGYVGAHCFRGNALSELNRPEEAIAAFDRAIAIDPGHAEAWWDKALALLLLGDYAEGWRLFEWRWKGSPQKKYAREYPDPPWLGRESVAGRRLLLHAEQGMGDIVQFCRYVPMVAAMGADVTVMAPGAVLPLLRTLRCTCAFVESGPPPPYDLHTPMMSLPHACATTLETVPADVPYLFADEAKRAAWRARLGEKTRPRIGLCWAGRPGVAVDVKRSASLAALAPLFDLPFEFHALHKEFRAEDQAALAQCPQIATHADEFADFSDTAGLIAELDLTISVDTAVAHVAGSLGKPVWIMLPWAGEWRWLRTRADSPWYPTATLVRQPARGDWAGVVAEIVRKMKTLF